MTTGSDYRINDDDDEIGSMNFERFFQVVNFVHQNSVDFQNRFLPYFNHAFCACVEFLSMGLNRRPIMKLHGPIVFYPPCCCRGCNKFVQCISLSYASINF